MKMIILIGGALVMIVVGIDAKVPSVVAVGLGLLIMGMAEPM